MKVKGVEGAVAFGILGNSHLIISVRNVGYIKSAGRLVREMFQDFGSAGGHRSAAKAVIPLSKMRKILGRATHIHIKKWVTKQFAEALKENSDSDKDK